MQLDDKTDPGIEESIVAILGASKEPISLGEILNQLGDKEFSISKVKRELQKLQEENRIAALPEATDAQGRPKHLYVLVRRGNGTTETKDEADQNASEAETTDEDSIMKELVRQAAGGVLDRVPLAEKKRIYRVSAERLMNENPVELFVAFAKWLQDSHSRLYKVFETPRGKKEREDAKNTMLLLEGIGRKVFNQWFGVPWDKADRDDPHPIVFKLKHTMGGNISILDEESLRKFLGYSVYGDHFMEIVKLNPEKRPLRIGGSDSSSYWVDLGRILPWNSSSRPLALITAAGAKYDINTKTTSYDITPDPRVLAQFERRKAIEEGYLITPQMLQDEDGMGGRIREAAMDLRQYLKDQEVLFEGKLTDIQFRDGRIFPVEHRFADAVHYGPHGDMVRRALRGFQNIVARIGTEEGRVLYCGFVKRVNLDVVAPLVLWYIGFGSAKIQGGDPIKSMTVENYATAPENYQHSQLINGLFSAMSDSIPKGHTIVTFRSVRRFQSMQEPSILNSWPSVERKYWEEILKEVGRSYEDEEYFGDAISIYAFLLARASVLTFYSSEPSALNPQVERDVVIPRIEVLVPFGDIGYGGGKEPQIASTELDYVRKIASVITDKDVMDRYSDELFPFDDNSPKVFMIPKPVKEAHEVSKVIAKTFSELFLGLLVRELKASWLRMQEGKL